MNFAKYLYFPKPRVFKKNRNSLRLDRDVYFIFHFSLKI